MPSKLPPGKEVEDDDTLVEELLLEVFLLLPVLAMVVVVVVEVEGIAGWHSNEDLFQRPCRHWTKGSPLPW